MTDTSSVSPKQLVGVVVVTFNSAADIEACLKSLHETNADHIVVFDNASASDQANQTETICSLFPEVTFVRSDLNVGFGAGTNRAAAILSDRLREDDFIWIVNPDTVVDVSCLEGLRAAVAAGHFDIVSPRITTGENESRPIVWFDGGQLDLRAVRTSHQGIGRTPLPEAAESPCSFVTGAAIFMTLRTWRALDGFSEEYFLYWEDADLSYRAVSSGLKLGVVAGASVWHAVGGSGDRTGKSATYYYFMQRNRVLFARRLQIGQRLLWGSGLVESMRLTLRPLKQQTRPLFKFWSGLRGLAAGIKLTTPSKKGSNLTEDELKPLFISWTRENGRSSDLAAAVDARLVNVFPEGNLLIRYLKSSIISRRLLSSLGANQSAMLMLPPAPLALVARVVRGKHHVKNVYDLHTGFFHDPKWQWAARGTLRLMRGATSIVTNQNLATKCREAGVNVFVLHDILRPRDGEVSTDRISIVCPLSYSNDEPIDAILTAARQLPETQWILTGNPPDSIVEKASGNVSFSGFLADEAYDLLIREATLVVALTNRRDTMQRAGYEALMRRVPVVTSDFDVLRDFFEGAAVYARVGESDLAEQVDRALKNHRVLVEECGNVLARRISEQQSELHQLRNELRR